MKKIMFMFSAMVLMVSTSCQTESINEEFAEKKPVKVVYTPINVDLENLGEACVTVDLIAGQHYVAGNVTVHNDGTNLIITYSTEGTDWTLGTTHLSIGNCSEDWVPLTGSGNPQIGQFAYTTPYSEGPKEVIYVVSLEGLGDNYCFAAHAEVQGPTGGETAWAEGTEFSGNSWAMFVQSTLSECPTDDDGGDSDDGATGGGDNQPT